MRGRYAAGAAAHRDPAVAIPGRTYAASLEGDGAVIDRAGSDIAVKDRPGRGWSAHYEYARGVTQAFSVGLDRAPFTVTATYTEPVGDSGQCTRTLTRHAADRAADPRRGQLQARGGGAASGLVLRCDGAQAAGQGPEVAAAGTAPRRPGAGRLNGRAATVTLSRPRECSQLDGFIYTRANADLRRAGAQAAGYRLSAAAAVMKTSIGPGPVPRWSSIHSWLSSIASKSFQIRSSPTQLYCRQGAGRAS